MVEPLATLGSQLSLTRPLLRWPSMGSPCRLLHLSGDSKDHNGRWHGRKSPKPCDSTSQTGPEAQFFQPQTKLGFGALAALQHQKLRNGSSKFYRQEPETLMEFSSHSLKCTTLSWLAKAGSDPHHRLVLGHHSSQKGSLEVYSCDMLSAPLRTLEDMLRQIRIGALHPDLTRSGHVSQPTRADCRDERDPSPQQEDDEPAEDVELSSGSESSSSSESTGSSSSENEQVHWSRLGAADPSTQSKSWGDGQMYQHKVSKMVHLLADSELELFKCGMKAGSEHVHIQKTPFLETRKCKRCVRAAES